LQIGIKMFLGIDAGSTFTKYVVLNKNREIIKYGKIKTPPSQKESYSKLVYELRKEYRIEKIGGCGYGKNNIDADQTMSELIALAVGVQNIDKDVRTVIDIGGQDSKCLLIRGGRLFDFVINDKCAAGAGMYISMTLNVLGMEFSELSNALKNFDKTKQMTTTCAVYAQTEIVSRMANNEDRNDIITASVDAVLRQIKTLVSRLGAHKKIVLTGGFSSINAIRERLSEHIGFKVSSINNAEYLSAYGLCINMMDKFYSDL